MKRVDVYYEGWGEKWKLGALAHHERIVMFEYSSLAAVGAVAFILTSTKT